MDFLGDGEGRKMLLGVSVAGVADFFEGVYVLAGFGGVHLYRGASNRGRNGRFIAY